MTRKIILNGTNIGFLSLAPMAGVSDKAYRLICKRFGCDFFTTEMISAKALTYNDQKTLELSKVSKEEGPTSIQIFGHEVSSMVEGSKILLEETTKNNQNVLSIDINMGCPVPKVVKNGDGSALMKDPILASKIVSELVKNIYPIPVTVKMRLGWDLNTINVVEFAKVIEDSGASLITIHARTRSQLYSPGVNWDYIRQVKEKLNIPIMGNGDVYSADDAMSLFSTTNCDGIAVARGSMGNPWIFEEIKIKIDGKDYYPPTKQDKIQVALDYLKLMIETKGERNGILESRKVISCFTKGMYGSPEVRNKLNTSNSFEEIEFLLNSLSKH